MMTGSRRWQTAGFQLNPLRDLRAWATGYDQQARRIGITHDPIALTDLPVRARRTTTESREP